MVLEWGSSFGQCIVTYRSPKHEKSKFTTNRERPVQHRRQSYFQFGSKISSLALPNSQEKMRVVPDINDLIKTVMPIQLVQSSQ
jgi:hypothetical protein